MNSLLTYTISARHGFSIRIIDSLCGRDTILDMESIKKPSLFVPVGIVLLSGVVAGMTLFIPVADGAANPTATHWRTVAGTITMGLSVGAAIVLLNGPRSFKTDLKVAYRLIAFGIMAFSAALIQLVIWGLLDLWDSDWAASGSGLLPYVVTAALIYIGTRKFAKLLGIHSILNSFLFVFGITLVIGILMGIAATYLVQYDLEGTDIYIGVGAWCSSYLLISSILVYKIFRAISPYYQPAMRWLTIGLGGLTVAAWHETINTFWFNNGDTYTDYGYYLLPWVVAGLILVRASYELRKLRAFGQTEASSKEEATDRDYIDSIVSVGGLASQPQQVDVMMDNLRFITSRMEPGQTLTTSNKELLVKTYRQLEAYLGHKDPLRTFSKDEILSHVTPAFRGVVEK